MLLGVAASRAEADPVRISLRTTTGNYLVATDASDGYKIRATPAGVGPWETFTVEPAAGGDATAIRSGDRIRLRTFHGRYVMARNDGGAELTGEATIGRQWETFTIEKLAGGGVIDHGDQVTLRADNNVNFVMAVNGGGGDVTASSLNRSTWETLTIEIENLRLVGLTTYTGQRVGAVGGGGAALDAVARPQTEWQTFALLNRSRRTGLRDGDSVALQSFLGKFVSADAAGGGLVTATANRVSLWETFVIHKAGGGEIGSSDAVWFAAANGRNFLMANNGGGAEISAASTLARQWETFTLAPAQARPVAAGQAITAAAAHGYPFAPGRTSVAGRHKVATFLIGFGDKPFDPTIANSDLVSFIHGASGSITAWVSKMSNRAVSIQNAGTFGPMTVPWNYVVIPVQDYWSGLMQLAAARGFDFAAQDVNGDGRVTSDELQLVVLDSSDYYGAGQKNNVTFTFAGKTYDGGALVVGINSAGHGVQGRAQLDGVKGTVTHELSHLFFDTPDRYYAPFPPRGDVTATGSNRAEWETLAFVPSSSDQSGSEIASGRHVRLVNVADGDFLVVEGSALHLLDRGGSAGDPLGDFIVETLDGGPPTHLGRVALRSVATGRYLMASGGGGDIVQAVAGAASSWETYTIERTSGSGAIRWGDPFVLTTSAANPYGRSFVLMGAPNGRRHDADTLARGWWTAWGVGVAGGGAGGKFDIMDDSEQPGFLSLYDRVIRGWLSPAVVTPGNRACYVLAPTAESMEGVILWDPLVPEEWYTIENRQFRAGLDEVPSNGLVLSWVNENPDYWLQWSETGKGDYPAVISAAAPRVAPNMHVKPVLMPELYYKRATADAAFRDGVYVLPKGDGNPSRFTISVTSSAASAPIVMCTL